MMSTYPCPKGHLSSESDYCSECGAKIDNKIDSPVASSILSSIASPSMQQTVQQICPDCATPRDIGDFCEICGFNFATGNHGELPIAKSIDPVLPDLPSVTQDSWQAIVTINSTPNHPDSPPPPMAHASRTIALEAPAYLIGRTSQARAVHPDIALDFDDAVSHRHAILQHQNGSLTLRDIGSSNGTKVNGIEITPMIDIAINDGDELTLGHWTLIKIKASEGHNL